MGGDPWTSPNRVRMTFKVSKAETEKGWRDELATINNLTSWSLARPISAPLCILLPWWPETSYKSDDGQSPARSWWPRAHIRCPAQTRRAEWPHPAWPSGRPAQCVITSQDNVILIPAKPVQSGAGVGEMIYFSRTHKHCLKLDLGLEHENIGEFSGTIASQHRALHSSQRNNASNNEGP